MTLFVDASAITAVIAREPEATTFADCLTFDGDKMTSAIAVWESVRAVSRVRGVDIGEAQALVRDFLRDASIRLVSIDGDDGDLAIDAHRRYGKGVHPADLNMGDCFAYASTARHGAAILFKGDDFSQTDLMDATLA